MAGEPIPSSGCTRQWVGINQGSSTGLGNMATIKRISTNGCQGIGTQGRIEVQSTQSQTAQILTFALGLLIVTGVTAAPASAALQEEPAIVQALAQPDNLSVATNTSDNAPAIGDPTETESISEQSLALADVIASVYKNYPTVLQAREELNRAAGEQMSAEGAYDLKLKGYALNEPTGFYRNYRHGIGVARQTWWGGYLSAGYRIGRGEFAPWYKERETEKAGELKVGLMQPLLQGRALDPQRVAFFQAGLSQQLANPIIQQAILDAARDASVLYWEWVAAGAKLKAQEKLLELAETRGKQFETGVGAGQFAEVDLILNRQLIAERQVKVYESQQKLQAAAFKLSLYLRDGAGQPIVPQLNWVPAAFPRVDLESEWTPEAEAMAAMQRRPELQVLVLEIQKLQWDQRQAQNQLLPGLDLVAEASQDLGDPASSTNDKGRFELLFGIQGEVPIQRRKARGKLQSTAAKIAQLNQKLRLQQNKIVTELQIQSNTLLLDGRIVQQAGAGLEAALDTLQRYRFAFERGKADLIYLNLLETKATETELKWLDAQRDWFATLAELQRALALDPLEESNQVSQLPLTPAPKAPAAPETKELEMDLPMDNPANPGGN